MVTIPEAEQARNFVQNLPALNMKITKRRLLRYFFVYGNISENTRLCHSIATILWLLCLTPDDDKNNFKKLFCRG
jgi:hypothetical protein